MRLTTALLQKILPNAKPTVLYFQTRKGSEMTLILFFIVGTAGFSAWFMKLTFGTPFIPALGLVTSGLIASIVSALVLLYVLSWLQYWLENLARKSEKPQN